MSTDDCSSYLARLFGVLGFDVSLSASDLETALKEGTCNIVRSPPTLRTRAGETVVGPLGFWSSSLGIIVNLILLQSF
jgi:hypothetical protein